MGDDTKWKLTKDEAVKMIDESLSAILEQVKPSERFEIIEDMVKMLIKFDSNLILDKKEV